MKTVVAFMVAIAFNMSTWVAVFAQTATNETISLIQLGGTAGLIGALMLAVVTLWKERNVIRADMATELQILRTALNDERNHHREEVRELRDTHKRDLDQLTERYLGELRHQISQLKAETQQQIDAERDAMDGKYKLATE